MNDFQLILPARTVKPRKQGLTILIDNGYPIQYFRDVMKSAQPLVDFVKFGWGTALVTPSLERKIQCLQELNIRYFFGGTLFEKFASQGKEDSFYHFCKKHSCTYIEISNGTIDLSNREKAQFIKEFSREFTVFSEVGFKDSEKSEQLSTSEWMEFIREDVEAGAAKVMTEAREGGTSGICTSTGKVKLDIIDKILGSDINLSTMIFEAPNKQLQTLFIELAGANVNLANISFGDIISLETLRLGLRSDTFFLANKEVHYERNK
ncbi:phosphosulfolactate synthase [Bacillus lacus]|uniref:Phosphosulfolactate synthase n=1 Tax=Metabacillus lacus TaxID=1983721 RepID=A0A7X2IZ58_9BACI|nr:phosphosulfolactate synthase [Metabacillus lacus]MRX72483.1 phosphosulfolactate synthase [Metabacillus lacus]